MSSLQRNFQFWHAIETVTSGATDMAPMTPQMVANDSRVMAAAKRPGNVNDVASVMSQLHAKGVLRRVVRGEYAYMTPSSPSAVPVAAPTPGKIVVQAEPKHEAVVVAPKATTVKLRQVCIIDNGVDIVLTVGPGGKITIKEV